MEAGDVRPVKAGRVRDVYTVETGMYDVSGYGCVYVRDGNDPAIIESGIGTNHDRLVTGIEQCGVALNDVSAILLTHVHLDHAGGVGQLVETCPNATVYVHERGAPHLIDPDRLVAGTKSAVGDQWRYYSEPVPVPEDRIQSLSDGATVRLGDDRLDVIETTGHASHHLSFHDPANDAILTGDAAGLWLAGQEQVAPSTPPPEFDLDRTLTDIERLRAVGAETLLYTHYGPAIGADERLAAYETTIRDWVRTVRTAIDEGETDAEIVDATVDRYGFAAEWGVEKARAETRVNVAGIRAGTD